MPLHSFTTALGPCTLHWEDRVLTGFALPGTVLHPPALVARPAIDPPAWVAELAARIVRHLAGAPQSLGHAPFAWERVTAFQRRVYEAALRVPAGATTTYGALAAALGQPPGSSRAIAAALGANPWPLLVPCHRIVGARGRMTGFSAPGGIATKLRLLQLEGAELFAS
jgi:methylated-DNA-[protein]-cysteine S-methyltransferase